VKRQLSIAMVSLVIILMPMAAAASPALAMVQPVSHRSGFRLALNATAGYVGLWGKGRFAPLHGLVLTPSLEFTWGDEARSLGFRISALASPTGAVYGVQPHQQSGLAMYGAHIGFLVHYHGFWLSPGLGIYTFQPIEAMAVAQMDDSGAASGGSAESTGSVDYSGPMPEATFTLGYDIPLGRHLALRFQGDVGTTSMLLYRLQVVTGLQVRF